MALPPFQEIVGHTLGLKGMSIQTKRVLAIDPGETTGYALFDGVDLDRLGQVSTGHVDTSVIPLRKLFENVEPDIVVVEEYRVYAWRAKQHSWSSLHTPRLIGCIETLCEIHRKPIAMQGAGIVKQFVTNDKLKDWGFYIKGQPHARDATRHACYFIIFNSRA